MTTLPYPSGERQCRIATEAAAKILKDIPYCESVEDYEALLPWNIELEKVGTLKVAA